MLNKTLGLAISLIVIAGSLVVAARYILGQPSHQPGKLRIKVLRPKDNLRLKPTAHEIASSRASQDEQPELEERVFENKIPTHLPVEIKIKKGKEKTFKDLKNDKWARDFAIELTNTGTKPIYSVHMLLVLPEVKNSTGRKIVFPLFYGRSELGDTKVKALPEDVPIRPGETYVFTIFPTQLSAWEDRQRKEKRPQPKIIQLKLQVISFGDGTGHIGNDGLAVPRSTSQSVGGVAGREPPDKELYRMEALRAPLTWQKSTFTGAPANFLPALFILTPLLLD